MTGWILIHRQIQDHWIWKDANKLKWWLDILLTVNNSDAKVTLGNEILICKRGESLLSIQSWATRWSVSKDTARNFFTLLEKEKMINRVSLGKTTRLTICNYETYQSLLHVKKRVTVRQHDTNKEDKNDNNLNILEDHIKIEREKLFKKQLTVFIKSENNPSGKYTIETVKAFFDHWSQWDNNKGKMAFELKDIWELSKRLSTWQRKESEYSPKEQNNHIDHSHVGN